MKSYRPVKSCNVICVISMKSPSLEIARANLCKTHPCVNTPGGAGTTAHHGPRRTTTGPICTSHSSSHISHRASRTLRPHLATITHQHQRKEHVGIGVPLLTHSTRTEVVTTSWPQVRSLGLGAGADVLGFAALGRHAGRVNIAVAAAQ